MRRLSVVIPTYERPAATRRAIASALAQGSVVHEVVVVDDASPTPFAADPSGEGAGRVRVLRLPRNAGAAAARNHGWRAAERPLVAFLDSDDVMLPGRLAAQIAALDAIPEPIRAVACGWTDLAIPRPEVFTMPAEGRSPRDFASGCWFCPGSTLLVERATLEAVGPFDESLRRLEDYEWFLRFGRRGGRLAVAPVAGAGIAFGRRGRLQPVLAAAAAIRRRHRVEDPIEPGAAGRLEAYLELECAAAARNEGRPLAMLAHLARSFAARPRTRLHLGEFRSARPYAEGAAGAAAAGAEAGAGGAAEEGATGEGAAGEGAGLTSPTV
jgi:glycosyltransferase involved in cell wall biosynthesis